MVAVRQKAPGELANRWGGRGRALEVQRRRRRPPLPAPPSGLTWGLVVEEFWRDFWSSDMASAVDLKADGERLRRWCEAIQERDDLLATIRREGYAPARKVLVEEETESGGKLVIVVAGSHPSLVYVKHLDKEIARLSEHFGMTPLSRFRLQLTVTEAASSSDRLKQRRARAREKEERAERYALPAGWEVVDGEVVSR